MFHFGRGDKQSNDGPARASDQPRRTNNSGMLPGPAGRGPGVPGSAFLWLGWSALIAHPPPGRSGRGPEVPGSGFSVAGVVSLHPGAPVASSSNYLLQLCSITVAQLTTPSSQCVFPKLSCSQLCSMTCAHSCAAHCQHGDLLGPLS